MTQTFSTNQNNDIFLNAEGNLSISTGIQAVADACASIAKTQLGEMMFEIGQGLPNFQTVWKGNPNIRLWQSYLQTSLQNVAGVTSVDNIELDIENNVLSYVATITTIYGITQITG